MAFDAKRGITSVIRCMLTSTGEAKKSATTTYLHNHFFQFRSPLSSVFVKGVWEETKRLG